MADVTKLSIKIGDLEFSGEGKESWLEKQLDKLLKAPVAQISSAKTDTTNKGVKPAGTLAAFLGERNARSNQVRKFLATAAYLQNKGVKPLKTVDISKALKDSNQTRLGNPSDTLNQNVAKGYCEKDGGGFFVTEDGFAELGM